MLGQKAPKLKKQVARSRSCVDRFAQGFEVYFSFCQLFHPFDPLHGIAAKRSSFQTTMVSPGRAYATSFSKAGLADFTPDALSVKTWWYIKGYYDNFLEATEQKVNGLHFKFIYQSTA
jgi:hypothetical protein